MNFSDTPTPPTKPIAHIWETKSGYRLEIAFGSMSASGYSVLSDTVHTSKLEAKRAAHINGAIPWNYSN